MKKYDIKAIEKLVDKMGDCYDYPDEESVKAMNSLIGQDWDAKTYWDYTSEYWSHHSLEETVWALIHDGEYPPYEEVRYCFWNTNAEFDQENEEVWLYFRLGGYMREPEMLVKFEHMPMEEIYDWFIEEFPDWENKVKEKEDDSRSLMANKVIEYGITQDILFYSYGEKCLSVTFTNVDKDVIDKVVKYIKQFANVAHVAEP